MIVVAGLLAGCTTLETPWGAYSSSKNVKIVAEGVEISPDGVVKVGKLEVTGDASPVINGYVEAVKAGVEIGARSAVP